MRFTSFRGDMEKIGNKNWVSRAGYFVWKLVKQYAELHAKVVGFIGNL